MCGIAGTVGATDPHLLDGLAEALFHRGPDGGGVYTDPAAEVGLVARRLAIIDLERGDQPMANADGSVWIVFNGEIFNAAELRARLESEGCRFESSHSDTELVLHLYEARGETMLDELNGMFAFVVYDSRRRRLFGARDRFGIKPLYYAEPGGGFAFASELRALMRVPGIDRELDTRSVFHYLSLRFVPGADSIYTGVKRLPAGHYFTYDIGERALRVERWWRLRFRPEAGSRDEWRLRVRAGLAQAVERWSLSDVPVACSLSGGVDSSAILALLAEAGVTPRSYTLGFTSPEDESVDELELARAHAERWGSEHHELTVEASELLDHLPAMVWALDEPYGGGLPSWFVFRMMSEDVKVGLTGTGGDELFGNYRRFVPFEQGRLAVVRGLLGSSVRRYHFEHSYYFTDREKRRFLLCASAAPDTSALLRAVYDDSGSRSARDSVLYLDVETQLADEFLLMTDRFSMAHSLEARVPFLDHELVELVASIPPELRTDAGDPKGLLRDAVADLLAPAHLAAPKRGFVFPLARWLRGELRPLAEWLLSDDYVRRQGIFRPVLRERYLEPHLAGRSDQSYSLWSLLMFQLWHLVNVEQALTEAPSFTLQDLVSVGRA